MITGGDDARGQSRSRATRVVSGTRQHAPKKSWQRALGMEAKEPASHHADQKQFPTSSCDPALPSSYLTVSVEFHVAAISTFRIPTLCDWNGGRWQSDIRRYTPTGKRVVPAVFSRGEDFSPRISLRQGTTALAAIGERSRWLPTCQLRPLEQPTENRDRLGAMGGFSTRVFAAVKGRPAGSEKGRLL